MLFQISHEYVAHERRRGRFGKTVETKDKSVTRLDALGPSFTEVLATPQVKKTTAVLSDPPKGTEALHVCAQVACNIGPEAVQSATPESYRVIESLDRNSAHTDRAAILV